MFARFVRMAMRPFVKWLWPLVISSSYRRTRIKSLPPANMWQRWILINVGVIFRLSVNVGDLMPPAWSKCLALETQLGFLLVVVMVFFPSRLWSSGKYCNCWLYFCFCCVQCYVFISTGACGCQMFLCWSYVQWNCSCFCHWFTVTLQNIWCDDTLMYACKADR